MYISQTFNVLHDWWRYVLGFILIVIAVIIGQVPLTIAIFFKASQNGDNLFELDETTMLSMLEPNLNLFLILLTYAAGLLAVILVARFLHKQSLRHLTTARSAIDWKRFWFAFILWAVISVTFIFIDYLSTPEHYELNFQLVPFLILCLIAVIFIPLQTSFEEYLFRGYLMQGLGVMLKNKWIPLVFTSLAFGLLHIANPEIEQLGYILLVYYVGTGFFLGIVTLMDDGLELALGFHAANNLFAALLVTADWTAFQTYSIFKDISEPQTAGFIDIFMPVFIIFPIMLVIFGRVYKWTNWKEKIFGKVEAPREDYKILE